MRKIVAAAFFILVSVASFHAQFTTIEVPGTVGLSGVEFVNEQTGFVTSVTGIFKTVNAGINWVQVYSGGSVGEIKFSPENPLVGYAAAHSVNSPSYVHCVLKTTDGGNSWLSCYILPDSVSFKRMFVWSANEVFGIFSGSSSSMQSQLYRTTDGGLTWNVVVQRDIYAFEGVTGDAQGNVFIAGSEFMASSNLINWQYYSSPVVFPFANAISANNRIYVGGDVYVNDNFYPGVAYTSNGGADWNRFIFPDSGLCWNLHFAPDGKGYVMGNTRSTNETWMARTTDQGETWHELYSSTSIVLNNVCGTTRYVYMIGSDAGIGTVVRYDPSVTGLPDPVEAPSGFRLDQNYPNPFNPETNISFSLPKTVFMQLLVYDVSGKMVATLADGIFEAGSHTVSFNGSALSSGAYFYTLQTDGFVSTKKMILVK